VPQEAAEHLHQVVDAWSRGGFGKYVVPVAYHFLKSEAFKNRSAEASPPEEVLVKLHKHTVAAMERLETRAGREEVGAELGFRQDLTDYLNEHLYLSFAPEMHLSEDALAAYGRSKRKGHSSKMCSLCNRQSEYVQPLRTGILDDFGRVFSNRVLPAMEAPGGLRPWCPICHLEFILRKLVGLGLPGNADYGKSYRIYLYVLPTFSFTPDHLRLYQPLLRQFRRVTNLPVRDYGKDAPGTPRVWLEQRELDPYWVEDLMEVLDRQTDKIAEWGGRDYVGERIHTSPIRAEPHYHLIVWEKAAYQQAEEAQIATRTEAWSKAVFAATIISGLTSCKVYVTERPYLPMSDPASLKPTITLDSPPPALRGLLGEKTDVVSLYGREKGQRSGLERTLDLSSALWMVTTSLRPNKDKNIAGRLEQLNVNPLAGAYFYKEYGRENEGDSPFPVLARACEALLEIQGGEMMGLVERIGEKSLQIGLPLRGGRRGKAHRYELVLREGMDALRKAFKVIPELRQTALTGQTPSDKSVTELKNLAAGKLLKGMSRKRNEIFVNPLRLEMGRLVGEFIDVLVDEVYLDRAAGDFARFLRMENSLADGIYYYTDRHLSEKWDEYNAAKAERETEAQS
jgi:CRISPR type I-D-associated protein Csc3/Cas10d